MAISQSALSELLDAMRAVGSVDELDQPEHEDDDPAGHLGAAPVGRGDVPAVGADRLLARRGRFLGDDRRTRRSLTCQDRRLSFARPESSNARYLSRPHGLPRSLPGPS